MRTRPFGRTGLEVSEIVLGGGVVGGILVLPAEETRRAALKRAVAAGVNWIDTAPLYGNGSSEETIGRYLPQLAPKPQISTKVRLKPEDLGDISGAIERSLEQSLKRLDVDRITLLQLHNQLGMVDAPRALAIEHLLKRGGVADAMDRLKAQGLIRASGLTALGETAACIQAIESGRFEAAQVYYNLLNPSAAWSRAPAGWSAQDFSGVMEACRRRDVAVMSIRALAAGVLASPERHGREVVIASGSELDREARRAAAVRSTLGEAYSTPAQAALRFVLANPDVTCTVVGIAALRHLDEALAAAEQGPLPAAALQLLAPLWAADFRTE